MAIASRRFSAEPIEDLPIEDDALEPRESTFTSLMPLRRIDTLLKYVDGSPWVVNFYSQILNTNNPTNHFDGKLGDLSQSYVEIKDLVLMVDSALSASTVDDTTTTMSLSGSSILPLGIKANKGDLFIANVDTGEDAVFVITNVTRNTTRKDSVYVIDYSLYAYTNDSPEVIERLSKRINETYYFDNSLEAGNKNRLVNKIGAEAISILRSFVYSSQRYYFETFTQRSTVAFTIPGTNEIAPDHRLTRFVFGIVDASTFASRLTFQYSDSTLSQDRESILDCLKNRFLPLGDRIEKRFGFVRANSIGSRALMRTPGFIGADLFLMPVDPNTNNISGNKREEGNGPFTEIKTDRNDYKVEELFVPSKDLGEDVLLKLLPEVFEDHYYIVSKAFYDYLDSKEMFENLSFLELMIYKYLNNQQLSKEDLAMIVQNWQSWTPLQQFYFLPVLWLLIRVTIGEI